MSRLGIWNPPVVGQVNEMIERKNINRGFKQL